MSLELELKYADELFFVSSPHMVPKAFQVCGQENPVLLITCGSEGNRPTDVAGYSMAKY
jgi:hypothetical protein